MTMATPVKAIQMTKAPLFNRRAAVFCGLALLGVSFGQAQGQAQRQGQRPPAAPRTVAEQVATLLAANPEGGSALSTGIAAILLEDPNAADEILRIAALPTTNPPQLTSIVSGYTAAQNALATTNTTAAQILATARDNASGAVAAALVSASTSPAPGAGVSVAGNAAGGQTSAGTTGFAGSSTTR